MHTSGISGTLSPSLTSKETASYQSRHASLHVRHARAVMHVGIDNPLAGKSFPAFPGAWATRNFMYLARGPWDSYSGWPFGSRIFFSFWVETGNATHPLLRLGVVGSLRFLVSSLYIYYIYITKATSYPYLSLHLSHIHAGGVALIALGWLVYLSLHLSHIHAGGVALIALGWLISHICHSNGGPIIDFSKIVQICLNV